jgi:hypothetical protein
MNNIFRMSIILTCVFHFIDFFIFILFRIKGKMFLTCTYFSLRCGATNMCLDIFHLCMDLFLS